jgi:hypothetical protein
MCIPPDLSVGMPDRVLEAQARLHLQVELVTTPKLCLTSRHLIAGDSPKIGHAMLGRRASHDQDGLQIRPFGGLV